jgi:hypothetical protein
MRNAVGAFLILVTSVAFAGGSHSGGGSGGGGGHAAASGGSGAHASAARTSGAHSGARQAGATPGRSLRDASEARRLALAATRPRPLRPKPTPKPTMPLATYPWQTTAAAHPAGWYAIACTEEERRQHKCDDQLSALPR